MVSSNHRRESKRNDYMEERITIESRDDAYPRDAQITLSFDSVLNDSSTSIADDKLIVKEPKSVMDRFLISLLDEFQLDSLSVSMSDSSDQTFPVGTDGRADVDDELHTNAFNFPVGTAIRYKPRRLSTSSISNDDDEMKFASVNEFGLLRALTTNGLLCSNVPVQGITEYLENQYTPYHHSSEDTVNKDETKMIILSEFAYTLCHTYTAYASLTKGHTCRDKEGILSHFSHERLNEISMKNKSMWLQVQRVLPHRSEKGIDVDNLVSIRRGLRFTKSLDFVRGDQDMNSVTLRMLLGGEEKTSSEEKQEEYSYDQSTLYPCPLMDSSQVITRIHSSSEKDVTTKYDLLAEPLSIDTPLYTFGSDQWKSMLVKDHGFDRSSNEDDTMNTLGIERTVDRSRGVSNIGTFQTRLYYQDLSAESEDCKLNEGSSCAFNEGKSLNVTIVDLYPRVVKPRLHSLRAILMQGGGAGSENFYYDPSIPDKTTVTHMNLFDLPSHNLQLSPEGSAVLSVTTKIPNDSSLYIMMDYQPRFLTFQQFPMDPNRGVTVPPSYVTIQGMEGFKSAENTCQISKESIDAMSTRMGVNKLLCPDSPYIIYSNALLILPPVPDMTMPFNVIALSTSLYALLLGTTINLLLRKGSQSVSDSYKGLKRKTPIQKLKEKLKDKLQRLKNKTKRKGEESAKEDSTESDVKDSEEDSFELITPEMATSTSSASVVQDDEK